MSRARNIKPGFYKNEDLAECSVWARLLFPGLWMLADREGRLEDRPKRIKGEIFPFDTVDVEPLLAELEHWKFLIRYEANGNNYIQITSFHKHQVPHYKEKPSAIPAMIGIETQGKTEAIPGQAPTLIRPAPPDSLNPDSLNPESGTNPEHTEPDTPPTPEDRSPPDGGALACRTGDMTRPMVKAGIRCNPGHPDIVALAASGCDTATVQAAIDEAKRVKGEGASITQGYVVAILKRWQAEPVTSAGNAPRAPPKSKHDDRTDWIRRACPDIADKPQEPNHEQSGNTIDAVAQRVA